MSRTYRAELAPWRLHEIHPAYLDRAKKLESLPSKVRLQYPKFETTCPYCGERDKLVAKIRVGAKILVENVKLTPDGFVIPNVRNRTTEILVIHCTGDHTHPQTGEVSWAAIDPMAYQSPIVFVRDRASAQRILES